MLANHNNNIGGHFGQQPRDTQHMEKPAQDADGQLFAHQKLVHRGSHRRSCRATRSLGNRKKFCFEKKVQI